VSVLTPDRAVSNQTRCRSTSRRPSQFPVAHWPSAALSTPARAVSTPTAPAVRSRHLGQFPMAHRPSVPRARLAGPALAGRPASRPCPKRHVQSRAAFLRPSESLQVRGPPHAHLTSERDTDLRLPYLQGPQPDRTSSPTPPGPPGHRSQGLRLWPKSRDRGGKAWWRRSDSLLPNRLAAARARSWRRRGVAPLPGSGGPSGLGNLDRRRDHRVAAK
jgi:hypothetical protein